MPNYNSEIAKVLAHGRAELKSITNETAQGILGAYKAGVDDIQARYADLADKAAAGDVGADTARKMLLPIKKQAELDMANWAAVASGHMDAGNAKSFLAGCGFASAVGDVKNITFRMGTSDRLAFQAAYTATKSGPLHELLKGIAKTTVDDAALAVRNSILASEGSKKMSKRLQSATTASAARCDLIARTEVARAYREATLLSYEQMGVSYIKWESAEQTRTCSACWANDGHIYEMGKVPNDHPRGRCKLLALSDTEIEELKAEHGENWQDGVYKQRVDENTETLKGKPQSELELIFGSKKQADLFSAGAPLQAAAKITSNAKWGPTVQQRVFQNLSHAQQLAEAQAAKIAQQQLDALAQAEAEAAQAAQAAAVAAQKIKDDTKAELEKMTVTVLKDKAKGGLVKNWQWATKSELIDIMSGADPAAVAKAHESIAMKHEQWAIAQKLNKTTAKNVAAQAAEEAAQAAHVAAEAAKAEAVAKAAHDAAVAQAKADAHEAELAAIKKAKAEAAAAAAKVEAQAQAKKLAEAEAKAAKAAELLLMQKQVEETLAKKAVELKAKAQAAALEKALQKQAAKKAAAHAKAQDLAEKAAAKLQAEAAAAKIEADLAASYAKVQAEKAAEPPKVTKMQAANAKLHAQALAGELDDATAEAVITEAESKGKKLSAVKTKQLEKMLEEQTMLDDKVALYDDMMQTVADKIDATLAEHGLASHEYQVLKAQMQKYLDLKTPVKEQLSILEGKIVAIKSVPGPATKEPKPLTAAQAKKLTALQEDHAFWTAKAEKEQENIKGIQLQISTGGAQWSDKVVALKKLLQQKETMLQYNQSKMAQLDIELQKMNPKSTLGKLKSAVGTKVPHVPKIMVEDVEYRDLHAVAIDVSKLGWQGQAIPIDTHMIEDQNALVYEVDTPRGKQTRVSFKLTGGAAQDELVKKLAAQKQVMSEAANYKLERLKDVTDTAIKGMAGVGHTLDANGKAALTRKITDAHELLFEQMADFTPYEAEFLQQYGRHMLDVREALRNGTPPPTFKPKKAKAGSDLGYTVDVGRLSFDNLQVDKGAIVSKGGSGSFGSDLRQDAKAGTQYSLKFAGGVEGKYLPSDSSSMFGDYNSKNAHAFQGRVELTVDGAPTAENIQKALDAAKKMGINTDPPKRVDAELLYLRQQAYVAREEQNPAYEVLLNNIANNGWNTEKQVEVMKDYWTKKLGKPLETIPDYNPFGEHLAGYADAETAGGRRQFTRFDVDRAEFDKEIGGKYRVYVDLTYRGHTDQLGDIKVIMEHSGALVSTTEKLRIGVPVQGASPVADLKTGGGSYVFTRIVHSPAYTAREDKRPPKTGLYFKPELLLRMDAISYDSDNYGRTDSTQFIQGSRKTGVAGWKAAAKMGGNETIFKDSVKLLDNIDVIVCKTESERQATIKVLRDNVRPGDLPDGRHLKDGRTIEELVIAQSG